MPSQPAQTAPPAHIGLHSTPGRLCFTVAQAFCQFQLLFVCRGAVQPLESLEHAKVLDAQWPYHNAPCSITSPQYQLQLHGPGRSPAEPHSPLALAGYGVATPCKAHPLAVPGIMPPNIPGTTTADSLRRATGDQLWKTADLRVRAQDVLSSGAWQAEAGERQGREGVIRAYTHAKGLPVDACWSAGTESRAASHCVLDDWGAVSRRLA
jgi:hypothetical protein